jgi:uncharacterized protein involved in exopolysaccharide biosynthesis
MTALKTKEAQSSPSLYLDPYEYVEPTERIGGYFAAVRRFWWVVLLVVLIAVGGALAVSAASTKQYDATAEVLLAPAEPIDILQQTTGGTRTLDPTADLNTAVQLVSLQAVARRVQSQLGVRVTPTELLNHVTVAAVGNSNLLGITAQDTSPAAAAKIANAFALQYVNVRRSTASDLYMQAATAGRTQLALLPRKALSQPQWKMLAARTGELRVDAALQTGGAQFVDEATQPSTPAAPNTKTNVVAAAVLGLFVGFLAALGLDRLRPRRRERSAPPPETSSRELAAS